MKNIIIYDSHFELINSLTDEQAGILIKAIGLFRLGQEPTITDSLVLGIFMAIKRDFIIQSENYQKKVKTNQENGKRGGRPSNPIGINNNPQNPVGLFITQPNPQNLKDKDKDKDKDNIQLPGKAVSSPAPDLFRNKNLPKLKEEEFNEIFFG